MVNRDEFLRLYNQGLSDVDTAIQCGCTSGYIFQLRKKHGLPANPQYKRRGPAIDEALALKLYREGLSDPQIAKKVFCVTKSICAFRQRRGLLSNYTRGRKRRVPKHQKEKRDAANSV